MCGTGKEQLKTDILLRIDTYKRNLSRKYQKPHSDYTKNDKLYSVLAPIIRRTWNY